MQNLLEVGVDSEELFGVRMLVTFWPTHTSADEFSDELIFMSVL